MPKDRRASPGPVDRPALRLDAIDRALLRLLTADARMPNNALAASVGIAPSTCLARVRALCEHGVIQGFHADVGPAAVDRPLQAMVAIRLAAHTREQIDAFRSAVVQLPGVLSLFHVAGVNDYLLHVATRDADALREFVLDHLTAHPGVTHAETSLIFEHVRGAGILEPD